VTLVFALRFDHEYLICIRVGYHRTLPRHLYFLVILHDAAPINTFPFVDKLSDKQSQPGRSDMDGSTVVYTSIVR